MDRYKNAVCSIADESIAKDLGIEAGDFLIAINNTPVIDVFDYRMRTLVNELIIKIEKASGEIIEFEIEKDEYEDVGLEFEVALMDENKACHNKCIFCFIDQLPRDMRESLYFKDDDLRLSFLTGNYVTLTNLSDEQLDRLISYRLSPMNISVHTTNPKLRVLMMKNKKAGDIMSQLKKISKENIAINCQLVLCPGINDGQELINSLNDLIGIGETIQSIAVVPVGVTRYRDSNKLEKVESYDKTKASNVIDIVLSFQKTLLDERGRRLVFASDEFYIKAGIPFPKLSKYEELPQLENGVGMTALFLDEMQKGIAKRKKRMGLTASSKSNPLDNSIKTAMLGKILLITGVDAMPFIDKFTNDLSSIYQKNIVVKAIRNRFFGESVTVAGLVTGSDIIAELGNAVENILSDCELIIIPNCMLRSGEKVFLDNVTIDNLEKKFKIPIVCVEATGIGLLEKLDEISKSRNLL